jgi:hypothetical protein
VPDPVDVDLCMGQPLGDTTDFSFSETEWLTLHCSRILRHDLGSSRVFRGVGNLFAAWILSFRCSMNSQNHKIYTPTEGKRFFLLTPHRHIVILLRAMGEIFWPWAPRALCGRRV